MSNKKPRKASHKKSRVDWNEIAIEFTTQLIVGIILLIIDKLIN